MKQTTSSVRTKKEIAQQEHNSLNERHLIRAGYFHKNMAGVYTQLPLAVRSIDKIKNIIRTEMNKTGAEEMRMPSLTPKDLMEKTGRWSDDAQDICFKSQISDGTIIGFGWTHEEVITDVLRHHIVSYKDLPYSAYQFQTKFRNELRAKSGIMRTREFEMKDLYSFAKDHEQHEILYNRLADAYKKVFEAVGLGAVTHKTKASGGAFCKYSEEFQSICDAGEDIIYIHKDGSLAINEEIFNEEVLQDLGVSKDDFTTAKTSEVGNIFSLGVRFSSALGLSYKDENGKPQDVVMGSYGIGIARLLGVIVETRLKGECLILPLAVAPYSVHMLLLNSDDKDTKECAEDLYKVLTDAGVEVLYDDRDVSAGEKFTDSDMIGIPYRIIVSKKTCSSGGAEFIDRKTQESMVYTATSILARIKLI